MKKEIQNVIYLKTKQDGDWFIFHEVQLVQSGVETLSTDTIYAFPNFYVKAHTDGRRIVSGLQKKGILCSFTLNERETLPKEIFQTYKPKIANFSAYEKN
jgi:hypothetical protein